MSKEMTFKERIDNNCKCPKCESHLIFIYGDMWDYDREWCSNHKECDYEVEYETSTIASEDTND